ncbi:MAG: hypothetical protein V7K89_30730 [Nostoc sp.]|uniref:hypothetical protein n=1 Tax=Nostoc sp. TaxID=1180 RepID=UPI002FFBDE23
MVFAAIALGIGRDTACSRQAMLMAGYVYAPEICSLKIPKNDLHLRRFIVKTKMSNCQQSWIKQASGKAKRVKVSLKRQR